MLVDDQMFSHPKTLSIPRKDRLAAIGLWTLAGSWCSLNKKGGLLPAYMVEELGGTARLAQALVDARLWEPVDQSYQFHDWGDLNPTAEEAQAKAGERSRAGSLGNHRRWHQNKPSDTCGYCTGNQAA